MKILSAFLLTAILFPHLFEDGIRNRNTSPDNTGIPLFSFGLIADVQYCDCMQAGSRYYRESISKLQVAVKTFLQDSVSFIVNLGDLIDRDLESYTPVLQILNSSGLKIYHCTGNHDYAVGEGLKDKLPVLKPSGNSYYSFKVKKFRMIVLNGNEISTYASDNKDVISNASAYINKLKQEGAINAIDWNGGIGKKQFVWFEDQLKRAESSGEKVIVFCHFPIAPENIHNLLNYKEMLPIIEKNKCVIAWISGHNHAGNYENLKGVHFVTIKGMVETETINNFAIVDVYDDNLVLRGYGDQEERTLLIK